MKLRAQVRFDAGGNVWDVTLWVCDERDVPYFVGRRRFSTWPEALRFAIRRVGLRG